MFLNITITKHKMNMLQIFVVLILELSEKITDFSSKYVSYLLCGATEWAIYIRLFAIKCEIVLVLSTKKKTRKCPYANTD